MFSSPEVIYILDVLIDAILARRRSVAFGPL